MINIIWISSYFNYLIIQFFVQINGNYSISNITNFYTNFICKTHYYSVLKQKFIEIN